MKIRGGLGLMIAVFGMASTATGDDLPVRWEKQGAAAALTSLAELPRALKKPIREGIAFSKEAADRPDQNAAPARPFYERAVVLLKSSCDAGDSIACSRLAAVYEHGLDAVTVDAAAADAAYRKAAALYGPACDKGGKDAGMACLSLGGQYNYGQGVPKDKEKAKMFFKRACEAGVAAACHI